MADEGTPTFIRASDVKMASADQIRAASRIRRAARDVLPEAWRVLPDGRSTAAVIAKRYAELERQGISW